MNKEEGETTDHIRDRLMQQLAPRLRSQCEARDADIFLIRLKHCFRDIYDPLFSLYGGRSDFRQHIDTLGELMLDAYIERPEPLRLLDIERQVIPDWFQRETMVGYVCYPELFAGTLKGVLEHLDYVQELGVTYLHLMPVLHARSGNNDGGYAVQDYRAVDPRLGSVDDLVTLANELHNRGISLCIDLVLNHTAQEHEWAQRAMEGDPTYLDYYYTFDDRTHPDRYERTLRDVFPDWAPGNFTWFPEMDGRGKWVWTTFNSFQWDLNYRNPVVFREMADVMLWLANRGVDVLRLDAIPFIWKRMGTDCENQPEAHLLVQAFRAVMRVVAPAVIFKAEAIVPPDRLVPYLGIGEAAGKECELAYHNQLMVMLWSSLATRKVTLMTQTLLNMPPTPQGTTWLTYVRNHDDIGWAITNENAASVGENGLLHRHFLNEFYRGAFPGSFARGAFFQYNPVTRDARMSGSTASLAGMEQAIETDELYRIGLSLRRILLLYGVVMAFGGIPLIYMGDELGLLNDMSFVDDEVHSIDNRWMHRPPMAWDVAEQRHDARSVVGRLYAGIRHLVAVRATMPALHGAAATQPLWSNNQHVFALVRHHPRGSLLLLANFHETVQQVSMEVVERAGLQGSDSMRNVLDTRDAQITVFEGHIYLEPYECMWLVD
jgi:amylosucrase